jgi:Xaa-Pro aminopeptidase
VERAAFTDEFWPMLLQAINRQTHSLPVYVDLPLPKYGKVLDSSAEQHVYWPPLPPSLASSSNDSAINPHEFLRRLLNNGTGVTHRPLSPLLHRMRLIKSNAELEQMRQSARHSCKAFAATLRQLKHSKTEHELAARFEYECKLRGSSGMSYVPVVAGRGVNACTIHYTRNDMELKYG